ncbi:RNA polymerase sigma-70 factor [Chryseolinea sp. H1M3-3]|uniref:RNA polymerase sigma-70 factor n=1 Tax=Chryseolinea sp. H1M3-3 TaxID=3034144 RepID=UPI0023EE19CD|nr:RNA polymerase sigma-70 factor [Chryseolinea sp. H1M3-3]
MLTHDRIIQEIREGNKESFQRVFHKYYEGLCQYAFTILRDMDDSEDVVQSMFIKIWEKRESLIITHTLKGYLFKAVYHQCVNQIDHRAVRTKFQEISLVEKPNEVQQPEVFPNELEERVIAAINTLPPQCRTIFMMSRYKEMRYVEIANALNLSINTIENQMSKALRILREYLKE